MNRQKAFTLIELLVVISIISLLASTVFSAVNSAREKARIGAGKQFSANLHHAAGDAAAGIWRFDECSGASVMDLSGNGNNGVINGPSWQTDTPWPTGCSLSFDGSNDYVSVTDNSTLDFSDNFSVSAWINMAATGGQTMVLKGDGTVSGASLSYGWNGNGFQFIGWNSCNQPFAPIGDDVGKWHFLVGVVSGGTRTLYVDGAPVGTPTNCGTSSWNNSRDLTIGGNSYNSNYAAAKIDDVRVYGKTLTAMEVRSIFAEGLQRHMAAR